LHGSDVDLVAGIVDYYGARYRTFGDSPQGMDWRDATSQVLRFESLTRCLDLRGRPSLLDLGCGNGELFGFLTERGIPVRYLGVDACPDMVAACQRRFGSESAILAASTDLASRGLRADFVVASGTFNVRQKVAIPVWEGFVLRSIEQMFASCTVAIALNLMSSWVDYRYEHLYYLEPERAPEVAALCGTRRFLLDHSYPLFEFTVALFR
jgi:SAM-dependent methyltransferase